MRDARRCGKTEPILEAGVRNHAALVLFASRGCAFAHPSGKA